MPDRSQITKLIWRARGRVFLTVTLQLWFWRQNVYHHFKPKDGRCVFLLPKGLEKQLRLPSSE